MQPSSVPEEETKIHGNCVRCLKKFTHQGVIIPKGVKGFCTAEVEEKDICAIYFEKPVGEGPCAKWGVFPFTYRDRFEIIPPDVEMLTQLGALHQQVSQGLEGAAKSSSSTTGTGDTGGSTTGSKVSS